MPGEMDPEALLDGMREKLQTQWVQYRKQSFNNNTKGAAYEKALKEFLLEYFEGIYQIETRTAVVDGDMKCFDIFEAGESELDVVATFKQAVPGVVFQSSDMMWVPYDGVAFICEVKSQLTKPALESDMEKLEKVSELDIVVSRFDRNTARSKLTSWESGETIRRDISVDHPLRCLVYDEESISPNFLMDYATKNTELWDIILIVDEDMILLSPELPFVEGWYERIDFGGSSFDISDAMPDVLVLPDGLVWFILLISLSVPRPLPFTTAPALLGLVQKEWSDESGYNIVNSFLELFDEDSIEKLVEDEDPQ
jgi:hypothetical protein